jgi:hypothetical protein
VTVVLNVFNMMLRWLCTDGSALSPSASVELVRIIEPGRFSGQDTTLSARDLDTALSFLLPPKDSSDSGTNEAQFTRFNQPN